MSINVSMTGSGKLGDIAPGWSVTEYATPVVIGDSAGGTGGVSFNAKAEDETLFIVNNDITTVEQDLGSIAGVITSVSQAGINSSISHNTKLSAFDANITIPALGAGGVVPALDVTSQIVKRDIRLGLTSGNFYSLAGHSQGFDANGDIITPKVWENKIPVNVTLGGVMYDSYGFPVFFDANGNSDEWFRYTGNIGSIYADTFFEKDNSVWATRINGDNFDDSLTVKSSRIAFKVPANTGSLDLFFSSAMWLDVDFEGTYVGNINIDFNVDSYSSLIDVEYVAGGLFNNVSTSGSGSVDTDKEMAVFIEFKRPATSVSYLPGEHIISVLVCNTSDYGSATSTSISYTAVRAQGSRWSANFYGGCGARSLYRAEDGGLPSSGWSKVNRNYIVNPSFESGISGWMAIGDTILSTTTGGLFGSNALTASSATSNVKFKQRIDAPVDYWGTATQASLYFKSNSSVNVTGTIYVEQYDSLNNLLYSSTSDPYWYGDSATTNSSWARVYVPITPLPGVAYINVGFNGYNFGTSSILVDGVMLTYSSSTFSPVTYFDGDTTDTSSHRYSYDADGFSVDEVSLSSMNREYENTSSYSATVVEIGGPVQATESNGWQYVQDACSAYGQEVALVGNSIIVRPVGERATSVDNIAASPTISPKIILSGRNVEVEYSNSKSIYNAELYNARDDGNRVLTVKANERIITKISLTSSPSVIKQPTRVATIPSTGIMSAGTYAVSSNAGNLIPAELWENKGGKIEVSISKDDPNSVDVTLIGPSTQNNVFGEDTAMYPGPYKIAYVADGTDYAALSLAGSGVAYDVRTLKLQTGADPEKVTQDVAKTITNPFIDTIERAYDRGIWLANSVSGPTVSLSGSIPVSELSGFGLTCGSLISYRDSKYRIMDVTIGNLTVSFNAVRHVTVEDFDMLWSGKTVGFHDLMWLGYDTSDQVIAPLRYIGDDESVLMFLDTDVNPYYDFTGEPEISVFPDTDANPYYEEGGNLEGEDEVRLDTDSNPYDNGDGYGS